MEMKLWLCNNIVEERISLFFVVVSENKVVFCSIIYLYHCSPFNRLGLFQFESRRHADFPLGLAFYINNIIVNRLSLCCEARCGSNQRIGGSTGAFLIVKMDKATPCRQ